MFKQNQLLDHPLEFDNAMYWEIPVSVWRGNHYVDYGGVISMHDDDAVYIAGDYFLKKEFGFRVRSTID
ncbi:hypothetical protein [Paenibacillus sedimenti]|uniref:Uncharacterized protein n=1 Tax=Paenibacillus sedimenti TaxID=2770274 RepID=A0A926KNQ3_9BACL|nr:hypothetical protein [Paenibacillus sedimenti]MBD0380493.1 hypothetical protein [Paenibacillus sedimenti]